VAAGSLGPDMTEPSDLHFKSVSYSGLEHGPRLIVTGAVHGNEVCGPKAIGRVLDEIDSGALKIVRGTVTFVPVTNPLAYAKNDRIGDRNLNRNLAPTDQPKDFEDRIANWLCPLLEQHEALLDLHSTRAATQPFATIGPKDNEGTLQPFKHSAKERALVKRLGVSRFVEGWLEAYAKGVARRVKEGTGSDLNRSPIYAVGTTEYMRSAGGYAITLECGQHEDPKSVDVGYRAIHNALAFLGISDEKPPPPVERYEALRLHEVVDRNHAEDQFARTWSSFDPVKKGELIAKRHDGAQIVAGEDGWIVFPDHKALPGNEWFYLAQPVTEI
jgi:predicted deacylase